MLKLHQLDIAGFKSFVDPVRLNIAGGITAIVGPNGCGKSNLSDAMTWVLGEQSVKSLRGTKMEDVIFAGSQGRKPVGMAEVNLTLLTDPSFPAAEDGRVVIGRRVFRSGQSQYRLNGKVVRLKQIKDLLMDTGLGIRAYSVIEQGKIGMILSGKPQERRKLLEEAAGITRYKARKRIAEVKLEEASANLLRLDDIISEAERSLRSLKRQASSARRFQARQAEYVALRDQVLRGRWFQVGERLAAREASLAERTERDAALAAELHRDEAALAAGREALDGLARTVAERHEHQASLAATIEGRQTFLAGARDTVRELGERVERGNTQAASRGQQREELERSQGTLDARTKALIAERDEAARLVADDETRLTAAQQAIAAAQAEQEGARRTLLEAVAAVNSTRSQLQGQQVEIERRTLRNRYLDEERQRLEKQLTDADNTLAGIATQVAAAESSLSDESEARRVAAARLEGLLRQESELSDARRALEARLASLAQRRAILIELSEEHEERRRSVADTLTAVGIESPRFLDQQLDSAAGWERSVDHYLGELANAVVLDATDDSNNLAQRLSAGQVSGCLLRPIKSIGDQAANRMLVDDPAVALSLAEALGLPPGLARALPPAYLVDEGADAVRLAAEHPGIAFISRERIWASSGVLHVQADEAAPGVLARERELDGIALEIPEREAELATTKESLAAVIAERSQLATDMQRLDERIAELRREMAVGNARRQDAEGRQGKLRATHDTVRQEQAEIQTALTEATSRQASLADALVAAEARHAEAAEALERSQSVVDHAKEQREGLREAGAGRRGRLELLEERLDAHGQEAVRLRRQADEALRLEKQWHGEAEKLGERRDALGLAITEAEAELQAALEQRSAAQDSVLAGQANLDRQREAIDALEVGVRAIRERRDAVRGELESLRVQQAGLRQDADHLARTYRDEMGKLLPGCGLDPEIPAEAGDEQASTEGATDADASGTALDAAPKAAVAEDGATLAEPGAEGDDARAETGVGGADGEAGNETSGSEANDEAPAVALMEEVEVEPIESDVLEQLDVDMNRAKTVLDRIGPVNVLAAQEYDEQEERHGFLTEQRADVATSVRSLKETIREINEASSTRFRETFETVNKTFGETYTKLFRGGEAEMRLLDEEDVLESGIEILARPPGKKLQNLMLLSGGEKALTAVALLFALFQTKPSPFCILDEVDAPLDDVNVLRFVEVLKEMSVDTQFLIVTHNKLTMEVAQTLYGVTMEEKGVSKLVSVELDQVDPMLPEMKTA